MKLDNLGNVPGYEHEVRVASKAGVLETPKLVLKLYEMEKYVELHPLIRSLTGHCCYDDSNLIREVGLARYKDFLEKEIGRGRIEPLLGLGFAILGGDTLNVARWDTKYPFVLRNQLYEYEGDVSTARQVNIRDVGAFCAWELGIVAHEKNAWLRYLKSGRTEADKQKYLDSFLEGSLDVK